MQMCQINWPCVHKDVQKVSNFILKIWRNKYEVKLFKFYFKIFMEPSKTKDKALLIDTESDKLC